MKRTNKFQKSTFVKNLISRRKEMGMSALEFSEFAKIKYPTLRDIEHGSSSGSLKTLQKIASALNTTIDALNATAEQSASPTKSELICSLIEVLPALNEAQLSFLLDGINKMDSPAVNALVAKHTKCKSEHG